MLFKPTFCCSCGEKIERLEWKPWTSRRFCQLCETEFGLYEWIPKIGVILSLFFGVLGVSFYWQKIEKPPAALTHQISDNSVQANKNLTKQINSLTLSANQNVQETAKSNDVTAARNVEKNLPAAFLKQSSTQTGQIKQSAGEKASAPEISYFCGAQTKKGTPCSRRRKSNSRCWQHAGQSAMLPPEKLKIN